MVEMLKYHKEVMVYYPHLVQMSNVDRLLHSKDVADLQPDVKEWCERVCPNEYEWDSVFRKKSEREQMVMLFFFRTIEQAVEFKLRFS